MDRIIIKVTLPPLDAEALTTEARERGIPRADHCREILQRYLTRSPDPGGEAAIKALAESLEAREDLRIIRIAATRRRQEDP